MESMGRSARNSEGEVQERLVRRDEVTGVSLKKRPGALVDVVKVEEDGGDAEKRVRSS